MGPAFVWFPGHRDVPPRREPNIRPVARPCPRHARCVLGPRPGQWGATADALDTATKPGTFPSTRPRTGALADRARQPCSISPEEAPSSAETSPASSWSWPTIRRPAHQVKRQAARLVAQHGGHVSRHLSLQSQDFRPSSGETTMSSPPTLRPRNCRTVESSTDVDSSQRSKMRPAHGGPRRHRERQHKRPIRAPTPRSGLLFGIRAVCYTRSVRGESS
jgi:hypothetical protein